MLDKSRAKTSPSEKNRAQTATEPLQLETRAKCMKKKMKTDDIEENEAESEQSANMKERK